MVSYVVADSGAITPINTSTQVQSIPVRLRYQTLEIGRFDIHLCTLRDKQQFSDLDGEAEALGISSAAWSMFGVLWDSSVTLANFMLDFDVEGKRVLEIGCGTGLTSLLLNKREMDITATDHHPEAEQMLQRNTELNGDADIPFFRTGWADGEGGLGVFDLIVGSDILYDREHLELLAGFIDLHINEAGAVVIVDPNRGECARFTREMADLGFSLEQKSWDNTSGLGGGNEGRILQYTRKTR
jgi:predicted nicotinamide N-methyase